MGAAGVTLLKHLITDKKPYDTRGCKGNCSQALLYKAYRIDNFDCLVLLNADAIHSSITYRLVKSINLPLTLLTPMDVMLPNWWCKVASRMV